jgi:T5SS/PEP-CTERM-associated repeat protein
MYSRFRPSAASLCLLALIACASLAPVQASGQATFIAGSGNWSDPNNWDCKCVPNSTNTGVLLGAGNVTLDISASVNSLDGSGMLSIDGQTLTASSSGNGIFESGTLKLTGGAVINSVPGVTAGNLILDSSTLPDTSVNQSANITSGTLQSLRGQGSLNISNSTVGPGSPGVLSDFAITASSQFLSSTLNTSLQVELGGALLVDQHTTINVPVGSGGVDIFGGAMTLQGGSKLNVNFGDLSMSIPGSPSFLTADGAGTAINLATNSGIALLGIGDATLTLQNQAAINGGDSNALTIGSTLPGFGFGTSHMLIKSGGTVTMGQVSVSGSLGTPSTLDITDDGSTLTVSKELLVFGGSMLIDNKAQVTSDLLDIGSAEVTDIGQVVVDTGGHLFLDGSTHNQNLLVGSAGRGTLTLQGGGTGIGVQSLSIGNDPKSSGTMTITGANSSWENAGTLYVGYDGNGTLQVLNQGLLQADGAPPGGGNLAAVIGTQADGTGTATVNGGTWILGGTLEIGESGNGTLVIATDLPGAKSTASVVQGTGATIGVNSGSVGSVTVSGDGARWDVGGNLTVGASGRATLSILNGGVVNDNNVIIAKSGSGSLGGPDDGSVVVDGRNSQWNNAGIVVVANEGNGSLTVSGGGSVSTGGGAIIGGANGRGTMTVTDDGSTWTSGGLVAIGQLGTGTLTIAHHGAATLASDIDIGGHGNGTLVIDGGDLTVAGNLTLDGNSTLNLSSGSIATGGSAKIGATSGSAQASVSGGSWTVGGAMSVGTVNSGSGSLTVLSGGQVAVGNNLVVNPTGTLTVQGGLISGNVVNNGGTITPGDATGVMNVQGDFLQATGTLLMEIDGTDPSQFDQLLVSGKAEFDGGTIEILFGQGFTPANGDNFQLILANLGLIDLGVNIDVQGLPPGFVFTDAFTANGFAFSISEQPNTPAPEPGTLSLFAGGLGAVLGLRRKLGCKT